MFRATPGKLPAADTTEIGGVKLPPGKAVNSQGGEEIAWISADVVPADQLGALIRDLAAVFGTTGLWPLQAHGRGQDGPDSWDGDVPGDVGDDAAWSGGDLGQPWGDGELAGPESTVGDALPVLLRLGAENADADDPDADPDRPAAVTALAAAVPGAELPAGALDVEGAGALLLVPVARPADVPHAVGWLGASDDGLSGTEVSSVLRSWEERFGAVPVSIGDDALMLQVARPPQSPEQLDGVLSEHYAFCPDNVDRGEGTAAYREGLTEWTHWSFWWD
ncbi:DUF4253 domain-containing protein [Tsukamurella pseudospumae]|uniref:DUF4253 domain-containing protein n=1 Tax=Tsukamurella pseudospumae TaxID=239498 RepID=A0A138AI90_9ACTN|nr:DUF4253 domain-containing protein [Tsukamurella pseudospumae]KXO98591.1 hypothetical protein AXK61_03105 [Tsukamurella pseudospumae]KXP10095.1 hypothetical protein AXK60_06300 [Tsukamurella pseudospumae]